jgi:hypothetical protein
MSLPYRQRHCLRRTRQALRLSESRLVAMMIMFARLNAGEALPARARVLRREVALLRHGGARVTVLTPGPEDLAAMGGNLMDHRHREEVFETSLATSAAAMAQEPSRHLGAA